MLGLGVPIRGKIVKKLARLEPLTQDLEDFANDFHLEQPRIVSLENDLYGYSILKLRGGKGDF